MVDEAGRVLFYEGSVVDITAEVAAEQALRQSEALYRSLILNRYVHRTPTKKDRPADSARRSFSRLRAC